MPDSTVPPRSAIAPEYTWNAPSVFPSDEAWEAELKRILDELPKIEKYRGHLSDGPAVLAEAREAIDRLAQRAEKVEVYAGLAHHVDRERVGITWATFPHLYVDYYVYQYATGIAGANALANRILSGQTSAAADYLNFLKAGSSLYPLDALKLAGVDMTTPGPVEAAFGVLSGMVDKLEALLGR